MDSYFLVGLRKLGVVIALLAITFDHHAMAGPPAPRTAQPNANACLAWTTNSLLANPYFQVAKNICDYAIQIEYRYEEDVGTGCFGTSPCTATLMPSEIRRFTAGKIHTWACRPPAIPKFPDIAREGHCE